MSSMPFELVPFDRAQAGVFDLCAGLWNAACGPDLAITPRGVEYATRPSTDVPREGRLALVGGRPAGFILADASTYPDRPESWVDAVAVHPAHRQCGIGRALLDWAEGWAGEQGAKRIYLGGGPRWFSPGLPTQLQDRAVFERLGYQFGPELSWDLGRSLRGYQTPARVAGVEGDVHPLRAEELDEFLGLLEREFGYWAYDAREYVREGGPLEDFIVLTSPGGLDAFCWITHAGSLRPLDRFFPHGLPRPWGQMGMVGTREARRGLGLSLKLQDGALRRLVELGVDGCIIDWTGYLEFYAKLGFRPHRSYYWGSKEL